VLPFVLFWPNKTDIHVIIDEELQVAKHDWMQIPITHRLITDYIEVCPHDAIYSRVVALPELDRIARNEAQDQIHEFFRGPAQTWVNPNWESVVNTEFFEGLKDGDVNILSVHSILRPKILQGFASVTIAGANLEHSLIYNLWRHRGVQFREDIELKRRLRFQQHQNGPLVTIKYLIDENWSKKLQNRLCDPSDQNRATYLQEMANAIRNEFEGQKFVYQANKSAGDLGFDANATRLPNVPHGLNDYSGYHRIAFLSAINPRSDHFRFLRTRGLSDDGVRHAISYSATYQSVMRISTRDPKNTDFKTVVVPDLGDATNLEALFPGCQIERLPSRIPQAVKAKTSGRPRVHDSAAEKQAEYRLRQKVKKLREALGRPYLMRESCCSEKIGSGDEKGIDIITHFVTPENLCGSFLTKVNSETSFAWLSCEGVDLFLAFLLHLHRRMIAKKEAAQLITPAIIPEGRDEEKILTIRHLWMDFEDGDLLPDEIARMFPHTRMVAFNSYRHTNDAPRFRVIIPLTKPVSPDEYRALYDAVIVKFEHEGYSVGQGKGELRSGLDLSGRSPTQLFYLPAQAQDSTQSFFSDYSDEKRTILDPNIWLGNKIIRFPEKRPRQNLQTSAPKEIDHARVERAISEWQRAAPGAGNDSFFHLGLELQLAGISHQQIEDKLYEQVSYARKESRNDRTKQIPGIIKYLKGYRQKAG
jgi:hypothetical protein